MDGCQYCPLFEKNCDSLCPVTLIVDMDAKKDIKQIDVCHPCTFHPLFRAFRPVECTPFAPPRRAPASSDHFENRQTRTGY